MKIPETAKEFARMRKALKLTQDRVAHLFGVIPLTVLRWENEKTSLNRSAAILMALLYEEKVIGNKFAVRDYVRSIRA